MNRGSYVDELFEREFRTEGGRYVGGIDDGLDWMCRRYLEAQYTARLSDRTHFDIVDSPEFNAWAWISDKLDLIGVTRGVVGCLWALSNLVSQFYSQGSLPESEAAIVRHIDWTSAESVGQLFETGFPIRSDDPSTRELAARLYIIMLTYVSTHEVAHVQYGHVDYTKQEFGINRFAEYGQILNIEPDFAHLMELEADDGIVKGIRYDRYTDLDLRVTCALLLFSILDSCVEEFGSYESATHPHPRVRLAAVLGGVHRSGMNDAVRRAEDRLLRIGITEPLVRGAWYEPCADEAQRLWDRAKSTYGAILDPHRRRTGTE